MSERMKPPARRADRTLGGGTKKATPPPPPPAAELTPEQYAAEQAATDGEGPLPAIEPQVQPAPSVVPVEASARDQAKAAPEVAQTSAQPTAEAPSDPVPEPADSQPVRPAVVAPKAETQSAGIPVERQVTPMALAAEPAAPALQPTQPTGPVAQHSPSAAPAAEVALRPAAPPTTGGSGFPVRTDVPQAHQEQDAQSQAAPSEGTPWAQGPGRPKDIPETAVVLNQRIITRESLDSSVPSALKLKKRIKRFALDNELDHLPIGDIVSVALDEWLTARGF
ncbi:hypothetical protein GTY75_13595 [Streptomyces sp. SID8381]|uniref:hypothetical protein n=1 Tax=unclassified Streptomyces TaxID=2593676 RepID=UPI000483F72B|nr:MULTISPECIES: hypothetical protein [unclassified Streptomyces]MYX27668.1 hypothetical protein [Streptomyces sp. SID8381]